MADGYRVERRRLQQHAARLERRRGEWVTDIPDDLYRLQTNGDEFTTIGSDLVTTLENLRTRYANAIVPGISNLMGEVVTALHSVEKSYGDAEEASAVAHQGDWLPEHRAPGDDPGQTFIQGMQ